MPIAGPATHRPDHPARHAPGDTAANESSHGPPPPPDASGALRDRAGASLAQMTEPPDTVELSALRRFLESYLPRKRRLPRGSTDTIVVPVRRGPFGSKVFDAPEQSVRRGDPCPRPAGLRGGPGDDLRVH